ncbi:uncharacterized protein METZ01_LOCUS514237, partial [marine metagenome]
MTLGGILTLLALGFWWAVNTGKRLNQAVMPYGNEWIRL